MGHSCFGSMGDVKNCWGYRKKANLDKQEFKDALVIRDDKVIVNDALNHNVRTFSYKELQKATNGFSSLIGKCGFSNCYKGFLKNGIVLAIHDYTDTKTIRHQDLDFRSLIYVMSRIRHRNVVRLIGFCLESDHRILACEFVGDYSLNQLLFDKEAKTSGLDWSRRASICLGIARGLDYLHQGISPRIVHRDIKPSNVLIDDDFNPKIVDLGTAHLLDDNVSHCSGSVVGTYGYIDPEYMHGGRFTEKADVYSFGIVVLEVVSGIRNVQFRSEGKGDFVMWVWELRESNKALEIVDPDLSSVPEEEVIRFIDVALLCVQYDSSLRPSMSEVLLMLSEGYDFSDRVLRKPDDYWWRNARDEFSGPSLGMTHGNKIQIESDLQTYSSVEDLMEMSHDLETELYESIESNISTAEPVIQPSIKPEKMSSSLLDIDVIVPEYSIKMEEQVPMSHSFKAPLYTPNEPQKSVGASISASPPVKPRVMTTSSVKPGIIVQEDTVKMEEQITSLHGLEAPLYAANEPEMSIEASEAAPTDGTSMGPEIMITSGQSDTCIYKQTAEEHSFLWECKEENVGSLMPKPNTKRPILHTAHKILEALKDGQSRSICLQGKGSIGKTTVLRSLSHHPATMGMFDQVLWVTVPRFAYRKQIQNEMVRQLSLEVRDLCSEDEVQNHIFQALKAKRILVLLDDVREIINLREAGIPNPGPDNKVWLVLATRSLDVCLAMSDRGMEVEALSTAEAWGLLCYHVGNVIDSLEIEPCARSIVEQCQGSPLITSAVGSALRGESSVIEWKHALRSLESSNTSDRYTQCSWYPHIKYCYDRLKAQDLKNCFLYCALFPEESYIEIATLVECFVNEGFLGGRSTFAYTKGHNIVEHLVEVSLLEANDDALMVKMQNAVRDCALVIISSDIEGHKMLTRSYLCQALRPKAEHEGKSKQESSIATNTDHSPDVHNNLSPEIHHWLTGATAQLKQPPSSEEWEKAIMIFLMDNELSSLPRRLSCPKLVALFLQRNSCLRVIPSSFFDSMSSLKILNLSKTRIKTLPDSIVRLINLQVLLLCDCERLLELPPSIELLKALEVLDLKGTELTHLPDSVAELVNLKQLRVSFYGPINDREYRRLPAKLVPDGVISGLQLRELGFFVYPGDRRWTTSATDITKEVTSLKLSALYFHFPEVENLSYFVCGSQSWKKGDVTSFNFIVGRDFKRTVSLASHDIEMLYNGAERCIRFVNGEHIPDVVVDVLEQATAFYLDHHLNICYGSEFGIDSMDALKICIIKDCPELLGIIDIKDQDKAALPNLEYLSLNYLWNMKRIWAGRISRGSLGSLKFLSVQACPKLTHIFTCSMINNLPNLEELVIEDCVSLKDIVIEDREKIVIDDNASSSTMACGSPVLDNLKVLKLHYLPKLRGLWTGRWPLLEYMSFYNCPELKNLKMTANDGVNIKEIAAERAWWQTLQWDDPRLSVRLLNHVTEIHLDQL